MFLFGVNQAAAEKIGRHGNGDERIAKWIHEVVLVKANNEGFGKTGKNTSCMSEKIMHIAAMPTLDPIVLEDRLRAIEASYQRQLDLAGKPGYDPQLTLQLKNDLDWLKKQRNEMNTMNRR